MHVAFVANVTYVYLVFTYIQTLLLQFFFPYFPPT
jgi:hypothetical protein